MRTITKRMLLSAFACAISASAWAQAPFPTQPVRLIVGFAAGTSSDILARAYAQKMSQYFGQQFVVESRVGASGNLAADAVAKSASAGHMLVLGGPTNAVSVSLFKKLPYDLTNDLVPVAVLATTPNIVVVDKNLGINTVGELIARAKARPGALVFGSAGTGTVPHLTGELFNQMAGVKLVHVPYRGNNLALVDLLGGRIALLFSPLPTVTGQIASGEVKALATTTARRTAFLPDLPTLAESGLPGFDTSLWYGFWAAKGTPAPVAQALADGFRRAGEDPEVRAVLTKSGLEPLVMGPDRFSAFQREEIQKWAKVVKESGIPQVE
jgi:tripartite-type tricarboxylate transporter receptor subunit TctC